MSLGTLRLNRKEPTSQGTLHLWEKAIEEEVIIHKHQKIHYGGG